MTLSMIGLNRTCMVVALYAVVFAGAADAAKRPILIRQRLVEAVSTTRLCPRLHVNRTVFERLARQQGIRVTPGSRDMLAFEQQIEVQVSYLLKFRRGIVCGLGKADFGPNGLILKDLLHVR